uniref:Uncharacterized protein n=1 Tax=Setaria digitata TaxID=48799 RepID=A0A915PWM7_9BILA
MESFCECLAAKRKVEKDWAAFLPRNSDLNQCTRISIAMLNIIMPCGLCEHWGLHPKIVFEKSFA